VPNVTDREGFTIERDAAGPPVRFVCTGELDLAGVPKVAEALTAVVDDIELDFAGVSFLDSSGIGALVAQQIRLREDGHRLRLVRIQEAPCRSLETLGLVDELT
jgi:anti-sigma B factor antagonist